MDTDGSGTVSYTEAWDNLEAALQAQGAELSDLPQWLVYLLDTNGDNLIQFNEAGKAVRAGQLRITRKTLRNFGRMIDTDGDSAISADELLAWGADQMKWVRGDTGETISLSDVLTAIWKGGDTDYDGIINGEEGIAWATRIRDYKSYSWTDDEIAAGI